MKEYNIKYSFGSKIYTVRNVKLIYINDPKFIAHTKSIIKRRRDENPTSDRDDSLRQYENMSLIFEKCIFHWMKSSYKRVIFWEEYNNGYWNERYLELDIVVENGDKLIVGEIKTKNSVLQKSSLKSFKRNSLLKCIVDDYDFYYIKIRLNKELEKRIPTKNINEIDFREIETKDCMSFNKDVLLKEITLKGEEVFYYGLKNNIIYNEKFLDMVYDECENVANGNNINKLSILTEDLPEEDDYEIDIDREIELYDLERLKEKFNNDNR